MLELRAEVQVAVVVNGQTVWKDGMITARTREANIRYDVRFKDGSFEQNVPAACLRLRSDTGQAA